MKDDTVCLINVYYTLCNQLPLELNSKILVVALYNKR